MAPPTAGHGRGLPVRVGAEKLNFISVQPIHLEFDAEALHACGICEGVRNGEAARGAILESAC